MFTYQMRVPYSDMTAGNHVYYSRYLEWLEASRTEAFREMGAALEEYQTKKKLMFPVLECLLKFNKAARYDDIIDIRSWFAEVGKVKFFWEYEVVRGEDILVDARTLHVCTSFDEKPQRMPADLLAKMKTHIRE